MKHHKYDQDGMASTEQIKNDKNYHEIERKKKMIRVILLRVCLINYTMRS